MKLCVRITKELSEKAENNMSYKLNLGSWGSVFAVPSCVVDSHLKIASEHQLKVLLYLLKNNNTSMDENSIGQALRMHPDDVIDALSFWVDREVISISGDEASPAESHSFDVNKDVEVNVTVSFDDHAEAPVTETKPKPARAMSRPVRPEPAYVIKRISSDPEIAMLLDETQRIFGKVISNADASVLIMLRDTDGLPVDVILMLLQYCVDNNKGTMRYVERLGIQWASEGINTVQLAEEKIRITTESYSGFNRIANVFGMKNLGSPTKKQLDYARTWLLDWSFSDDMLRLAYERCVDSKGELNLSYINAILDRWHKAGWKNPDDVDSEQVKKTTAKVKKSKRSNMELESDASYDIDEYEKKSIFD